LLEFSPKYYKLFFKSRILKEDPHIQGKQIKERIKKQFGTQASYYAKSKPHSSGDSLQLIVSWAEPNGDEIMLDIATGTGFTAFAFAPYVSRVIALDITPEMIDQAKAIAFDKRITNISFQVGESERLPFKDGIFNIVTCRIAAHHFVDIKGFLSEVKRVLVPGGRFLLVDSCSPENKEINRWHNHIEKLRDPSHVTNYLPSAWEGMVEESGMVIEKIDAEVCRTYLSFSDWTRTAGCSEKVKEELLALFRSAPRYISDAFQIYEENGDIHFSWPLILVKARKLQ